MRHSYEKETETRAKVMQFLSKGAMVTERVVYYSPTQTRKMLENKGVSVSLDYLIRRYGELNIVYRNGIWIRDLK